MVPVPAGLGASRWSVTLQVHRARWARARRHYPYEMAFAISGRATGNAGPSSGSQPVPVAGQPDSAVLASYDCQCRSPMIYCRVFRVRGRRMSWLLPLSNQRPLRAWAAAAASSAPRSLHTEEATRRRFHRGPRAQRALSDSESRAAGHCALHSMARRTAAACDAAGDPGRWGSPSELRVATGAGQ
jgi:hypothetical protein